MGAMLHSFLHARHKPLIKSYKLLRVTLRLSTGLYRNFDGGLIYCTPVTAALLIREQGIPAARIVSVSLDQPHTLDGVRFTFMDANHCPGAAMILFEVPAKDKAGDTTVGARLLQCTQHTGLVYQLQTDGTL